jgi:sporulation protein YlmC with PRC-barrel domain
MKLIKPVVLAFSLLAYTGAYAQVTSKEQRDAEAKPPMTQPESRPSGAASGAAAGTTARDEDRRSGTAAGATTTDRPTSARADAADMTAKRLMDAKVVDAEGKTIGDIDEVVLDLESGRVHAVVVGFGGFLGLGEKHYAFPVSELQPGKERNRFVMNVDRDKLKDQQALEKDKWPEMTDDYWRRLDSRERASAGDTQQAAKMKLVRASKLIGKNIEDQAGENVGEVRDVILSSDRSKIEHVVVNVKGGGDARVEHKALSFGPEDKLVLEMPAGQLKAEAGVREREGAAAGGSRADERKSPRAHEKSKANEKKY